MDMLLHLPPVVAVPDAVARIVNSVGDTADIELVANSNLNSISARADVEVVLHLDVAGLTLAVKRKGHVARRRSSARGGSEETNPATPCFHNSSFSL